MVPQPFESYVRALDDQLAGTPGARIFTATDCGRFLERLRARYGERVVYTAARRSRDGRPVHFGNSASAEEVLIDALLLARTRHLVHGISNVSAAVLAFNRTLSHTSLATSPGGPGTRR